MSDIERKLAELNGMTESDLRKTSEPTDRITELERSNAELREALEALIGGATE